MIIEKFDNFLEKFSIGVRIQMSFVFDIPRLVFGEAAEKAGCCGTLMQAFFRRLREKQEKKTAWNDNRIETP